MNTGLQLVFKQEENSVLMTDSRRLAEGFGSNHYDLLRKIDRIINMTEDKEFTKRNFTVCHEISELQNGKPLKLYQMTRDGFMFIALTFTGVKGNAFRIKVLQTFNEMESQLKALNAPLPQDPIELAQFMLDTAKKERGLRLVAEGERDTIFTKLQAASEELNKKTLAVAQLETDIKTRPTYIAYQNCMKSAQLILKYPKLLDLANEWRVKSRKFGKGASIVTQFLKAQGIKPIGLITDEGKYSGTVLMGFSESDVAALLGQVVVVAPTPAKAPTGRDGLEKARKMLCTITKADKKDDADTEAAKKANKIREDEEKAFNFRIKK